MPADNECVNCLQDLLPFMFNNVGRQLWTHAREILHGEDRDCKVQRETRRTLQVAVVDGSE